MANYVCSARSNYFRVKDAAAFRKEMEDFDVEVWDKGEDLFGLAATENGWPTYRMSDDLDGHELDFMALIAAHLAYGEVAVFIEIGYEKLRYLVGGAVAVNHLGDAVSVNLNDIYEKAETAFGVTPALAEY